MSLADTESLTFTTLLWSSLLGSGNAITGDVKKFPDGERRFFEDRGNHSIAVLPLFKNDSLWGFVGFSDTVPPGLGGQRDGGAPNHGNLIGAVLESGANFFNYTAGCITTARNKRPVPPLLPYFIARDSVLF